MQCYCKECCTQESTYNTGYWSAISTPSCNSALILSQHNNFALSCAMQAMGWLAVNAAFTSIQAVANNCRHDIALQMSCSQAALLQTANKA